MESKRNHLLCEASAHTRLSGQVVVCGKGLHNSFACYPGLLRVHVFHNHQGRLGTDRPRAGFLLLHLAIASPSAKCPHLVTQLFF